MEAILRKWLFGPKKQQPNTGGPPLSRVKRFFWASPTRSANTTRKELFVPKGHIPVVPSSRGAPSPGRDCYLGAKKERKAFEPGEEAFGRKSWWREGPLFSMDQDMGGEVRGQCLIGRGGKEGRPGTKQVEV